MNYLRELVGASHLIVRFAARDVRVRYKQTVLGFGWAVAQPVSLMLAFTLVFGRFAHMPSDGIPYPLFTYSTLIFWTFFSNTVSQGTAAITANASLIRKIYFPRETLLLSVMLSASLDLAVALSVLVALFVYYQVSLPATFIWVLPLFFVQIAFTLGIICITSSIHVRFRDIGFVLPLALQLWMFATPVAYPLSVVPERFRSIYMLNPMVVIIDGYRQALLHGQAPPLTSLGIFGLGALALSVAAYLMFKWGERTFADVV